MKNIQDINKQAIVVNPAPYFREYMVNIDGAWYLVEHVSGQDAHKREKGGALRSFGIKHRFTISRCSSAPLPSLVRKFVRKYLSDGIESSELLVLGGGQTNPPPRVRGGWVKEK